MWSSYPTSKYLSQKNANLYSHKALYMNVYSTPYKHQKIEMIQVFLSQ
jgi:hypothetical protein